MKLKNVIIYGAGSAGRELLRSINENNLFNVVAFIDDALEYTDFRIQGLAVYQFNMLEHIIESYDIHLIIVAISNIESNKKFDLIRRLLKFNVPIKYIPKIEYLNLGVANASDLKDIDLADLLSRDSCPIFEYTYDQSTSDKIVLISGAGGSIGSEISRQICRESPSRLLLVDFNEYNLYKIHLELVALASHLGLEVEIIPVLIDLLSRNDLARIFIEYNPEVVFHSAAYKHVPMIEKNPIQGVRNNIIGTQNIVELSREFGVASFVLISTDKAVRPTNIMGATKRVCELIVQAHADRLESPNGCCFSIVRFGNVLGSSGSVIPLFLNQISSGGPITLTHKDVTRFFMTIEEASSLVIHSSRINSNGEIYLLNMGEPVRIFDLARMLIYLSGKTIRSEHFPDGDIEIKFIGLRPGEKLFEELLIEGSPVPVQGNLIYKANEPFLKIEQLYHHLWSLRKGIDDYDLHNIVCVLKEIVSGFDYSGDDN